MKAEARIDKVHQFLEKSAQYLYNIFYKTRCMMPWKPQHITLSDAIISIFFKSSFTAFSSKIQNIFHYFSNPLNLGVDIRLTRVEATRAIYQHKKTPPVKFKLDILFFSYCIKEQIRVRYLI